LEADDKKIANQVRVAIFGATAHVFLLKAVDPSADRGFDFTLRLHESL
jgi:hypothetical protein